MLGRRNNKNLEGEKGPIEGLLPIVKDRLQNEVFQKTSELWNSIVSKSPHKDKLSNKLVLIVDDASMRIVSSALGMYKLTECNVYLVEHLTKIRAPYRKNAPIYLLSPTEDSINRLIHDWTPSKTRKEPLYADNVFLYFTNSLPDNLLQKIKTCKPLLKRVRALGEVNIDFIPTQTRAFHLDMKSTDCFAQLYRTTQNGSMPIVHTIAEKLVTVCASLHEYPHIRFKASSRVGSTLAKLFSQKLNEFVGKNKDWWYHGDSIHTDKGRSTLLIFNRTDDCLSPLIHEFTYQAMVNDLLTLEDDKITFMAPDPNANAQSGGDPKAKIAKDALLNENDHVWAELREKHIVDVIQVLSTRIRDIVNSNTGVALNKKGKQAKSLSLAQMTSALKNLPDYQEIMSKLSQHMHISHACMDIFKAPHENLLSVCDIEQTLATGETDEGRSAKVAEMVESVVAELENTHNVISRFRLLAIFIVSQGGLKQSDQGRLFTAANLGPEEIRALGNLEALGIPLEKPLTTSRIGSSFGGEKLVARGSVIDNTSEYSLSRYACDLKDILSKMHENKLSFEEYPSVYPMPEESMMDSSNVSSAGVASVRDTSSKYSRNRANGAANSGSRQLVFVAGGCCFSELRAANELMNDGGPEIIIGSTHFCDPKTFVKDIASL